MRVKWTRFLSKSKIYLGSIRYLPIRIKSEARYLTFHFYRREEKCTYLLNHTSFLFTIKFQLKLFFLRNLETRSHLLEELLLTFFEIVKYEAQHLIFCTSQPFNHEICYFFPFPIRLQFSKNENKQILASLF